MDEFTKIILSAFQPFIAHHQKLLASVKSVFLFVLLRVFFKSFLKEFLSFFYNMIKLRNRRVG